MAETTDERIPLYVTVLDFIVNGYGFLLTCAAGGIAGANIFPILGHAVNTAADLGWSAQQLKLVGHGGWVLGVVAAGVGAAIKWWKAKPRLISKSATAAESEHPKGKKHGVFGSMAWAGAIGSLLGMMLGLTFVLFWFSITYSPFAPRSWVESVRTVEHRRPDGRREHGITSNHPVLWYAFGIPVGLGAATGTVLGAFVPVYSMDE